MILAHPTLDKMIVFNEEKVEVMVIENKTQLSKYISELNLQIMGEDGSFLLFDECGNEIPIASIDLIIDPFNLNLNNKNILSTVSSRLKSLLIDENHYQNTTRILQSIEQHMSECVYDLDSHLFVSDDYNCIDLIKIANPRFIANKESIVEQLCDYICVMKEYLEIELFVLINLKTFLNQTDIEELYKYAFMNKIHLLLLENKIDRQLSFENVHIIDQDLCEINTFSRYEGI